MEDSERPRSRRPRRRGRTALLIATAAVLGVVGGTCTGYLIQADRSPTPLPPLSQATLAQAKGPAPEPLPAAQDRKVRTDGDLRKLLLSKPRGAKRPEWLEGSVGWVDVAAYAGYFEHPADAFRALADDEFRRAAVTGWETSDRTRVEIRLIQYRQEERTAAAAHAKGAQNYLDEEGGTRSWPVPGTEEGRAYVRTRPSTKAGYLPLYSAEAHAWRGDIAVEMWVYSSSPVPKATIMDLAKRQMERL
ncbi:hypothetical protein [Streptomyces sp. NPDC003374]